MERYCTTCGKLLQGRIDKKFCDDICRNRSNNEFYRNNELLVRKVNRILRKNKTILEKLYTGNHSAVTAQQLISAGFDFNYYTHRKEDASGKSYSCCYEYTYTILNEHEISIRKDES